MNVVFLDIDGVVNIPFWEKTSSGQYHCTFNSPGDATVNSFQACQWVSEFCEKYGYAIVVSSTWRLYVEDLAPCLYASGIREAVEIIGETPVIYDVERGIEISKWLSEHPEVENYLIFDDDGDMPGHMDKWVKCDGSVGFTINEYYEAEKKHKDGVANSYLKSL